MADQTLVQGAGLIAQSKGVGKLAAAGAWTKMSTDLSKKLAPVIQERHQTWEKYSNYRLAKEGLDDDDFDALYGDLEQKRREYIWGDKKARAKMMQDVDFLASQITDVSSFQDDIADATGNDEEPLSDAFLNSDLGSVYMEILNGDRKPEVGEDGKMTGFTINSGLFDGTGEGEDTFYTLDELRGVIDDYKYDSVSSGLMGKMMESMRTELENKQPGEDTGFNYWSRFQNVKHNLVDEGQLRSLAMDEHIKGRTFYNDLQGYLMTNTYDQLGIDSSDFVDPNTDGDDDPSTISEDDAKIIADEIISNETVLKDQLARYYTNYMQQNWDMAAGERDDDNDKVLNKDDSDYNHPSAVYAGEYGSVTGEISGAEAAYGNVSPDGSWTAPDFPLIDSSITSKDETKAIKRLKKTFPFDQYGFKFEHAGSMQHDKIKIIAPNGEEKIWHIDAPVGINIFSKGEFGGRGKSEDDATGADMTRWMMRNQKK